MECNYNLLIIGMHRVNNFDVLDKLISNSTYSWTVFCTYIVQNETAVVFTYRFHSCWILSDTLSGSVWYGTVLFIMII